MCYSQETLRVIHLVLLHTIVIVQCVFRDYGSHMCQRSFAPQCQGDTIRSSGHGVAALRKWGHQRNVGLFLSRLDVKFSMVCTLELFPSSKNLGKVVEKEALMRNQPPRPKDNLAQGQARDSSVAAVTDSPKRSRRHAVCGSYYSFERRAPSAEQHLSGYPLQLGLDNRYQRR